MTGFGDGRRRVVRGPVRDLPRQREPGAGAEDRAATSAREPGKAEVFQFANENIFVKILDNVREKDVFLVQPTSHPVNQSIMELLIMIDAFKRASAGRITAVIPFYAYGRSDKKDQPRVPITARLIADMITVAGADRVLTMDLHQGQIQGFFNIPVDELTAVHLLSNYFIAQAPRRPRRRHRPRLRQARPGVRRARSTRRWRSSRSAGSATSTGPS